ncbi:MAG: hypothetical protein J6S63_02040 [Atopobiaceae bacterium]|nr:hypothetical protein [Atopobiaceae bacterium]
MAANQKVTETLQLIATTLAQQANGHQIHSRIFAAQGFTKLEEKYAEHAEEERGFMCKCIDRLLDLGCEVKFEALEAGPVYTDPVEYIKYDLSLSRDESGIAMLRDVIAIAAREDYESYDVLKDYIEDENEDAGWMELQLELVEKIGLQNWLARQL